MYQTLSLKLFLCNKKNEENFDKNVAVREKALRISTHQELMAHNILFQCFWRFPTHRWRKRNLSGLHPVGFKCKHMKMSSEGAAGCAPTGSAVCALKAVYCDLWTGSFPPLDLSLLPADGEDEMDLQAAADLTKSSRSGVTLSLHAASLRFCGSGDNWCEIRRQAPSLILRSPQRRETGQQQLSAWLLYSHWSSQCFSPISAFISSKTQNSWL